MSRRKPAVNKPPNRRKMSQYEPPSEVPTGTWSQSPSLDEIDWAAVLSAAARLKTLPKITYPPVPVRLHKSRIADPERVPDVAARSFGVQVDQDPTDPNFWLVRFDLLAQRNELPKVGPCEEQPTPCNNGPLDGIEDDDEEEESHEELDGAP